MKRRAIRPQLNPIEQRVLTTVFPVVLTLG